MPICAKHVIKLHDLKAVLCLLICLSSCQGYWYANDSSCAGLVEHAEPRREPWNVKFAAQLAREVRQADAGQGFDLIFYGDSITEAWRGTDQSGPCERCQGDSELFDKYFGQYRADVLAVGGDQVGHLQWRLLHGDIPVRHHPRLAVVMIGTNDLGAVDACTRHDETEITDAVPGIVERLKFTIELLQDRMPKTEILLLGLTPRGNGFTRETAWVWPSIFTTALEQINAWQEKQADIRPGVHYLDCGPDLLVDGKLTPEMFVDGLHPSPAAMDLMGACISKTVDRIMLPTLEKRLTWDAIFRLPSKPLYHVASVKKKILN